MTLKGQVTIPKTVRDALDLQEEGELLSASNTRGRSSPRRPDFISMTASVPVPASTRGTPWDEVLRETRRATRGAPSLTTFIDTNVLIGHLIGDLPEMAPVRSPSGRG